MGRAYPSQSVSVSSSASIAYPAAPRTAEGSDSRSAGGCSSCSAATSRSPIQRAARASWSLFDCGGAHAIADDHSRSEEHTSELQSQFHLVCRLLLEKK